MSEATCGACAGSGKKSGRFMTPCSDWPCPLCGGKGHGGRAAGVPPDRYIDWILGRWRADGARNRTDENLESVFG